ncbi:hypothetical protein D3C72_1240080 [compost metagenome]
MINRNKGDADDNHRQRKPEVKLHEAHPVIKSLSWSRKEGNSAGLGCHYRNSYGIPRSLIVPQDIILHVFAASSFPGTIKDDEKKCND